MMTMTLTLQKNNMHHHDWRQEQMSLLERLEENTKHPRKIAQLRRRFLEEEEAGGLGLPHAMMPLLEHAVDCFVQQCIMTTSQKEDENDSNTCRQQQLRICGTSSMMFLERILQVHLACAKLDPIVAEELGRQGTHAQLVRLLQLSDKFDGDLETAFPLEEDLDALVWMQDLAGEIASTSAGKTPFPLKTCPFSVETLKSRLPLHFTIASPIVSNDYDDDNGSHHVENVLIHQVCSRQSAQEDVGFGTCLPPPPFSFCFSSLAQWHSLH
jgi:hypothetical protein